MAAAERMVGFERRTIAGHSGRFFAGDSLNQAVHKAKQAMAGWGVSNCLGSLRLLAPVHPHTKSEGGDGKTDDEHGNLLEWPLSSAHR